MKYKHENLPGDYIDFMNNKIMIGKKIAAFFFKNGFDRVIFHFDYKNKSVLIEGMNDEKAKTYEYPIIRGMFISSCQPYISKGNKRWAFYIETKLHRKAIDFQRRYLKFQAKPISNDTVAIENVPLLNIVDLYYHIIDMSKLKIITNSVDNKEKEKSLDPVRASMGANTKKWIEHFKLNKLNKTTSTIVHDEYETIKKNQKDKATPLKSAINKEIDNVWGFEKPAGKLPSTEDRIEADKRNKKTILGE